LAAGLVALLAGLVAAQPARSLGPAVAGVGPASAGALGGPVVTTTTGPTTTAGPTTTSTSTTAGPTTTTLANASPSWVNSMLAAWMLDEPSGVRVNAQGTTSRNLTETNGPWNSDPDHMEGIAGINPVWGGRTLVTSDTTLAHLAPPFTCGAWLKVQNNNDSPFQASNGTTDGFVIKAGIWNWQFTSYGGTANVTTSVSGGAWNHYVFKMAGGTLQTYVNGATSSSVSGTYTPSTGTTFVVAPNMNSNMDEAWCAASALSNVAVCRICSCGVRGEQCSCSGTTFNIKGRNATVCGSCTLPADCTVTTPP